jgi:UDP-N-acetylglucosamine 2-epimerase (non-hydrolysing)
MAPLIREFQKYPDKFQTTICLTGQHRQMLDQINNFFGIKGDYDLNLMQLNQTLVDITSRCLLGLKPVLEKEKPDLAFVQGDTTSVLAASLACYYEQIPVAHLEAGLRSGNKYSPFPEEINRTIAGHIAEYQFAPTAKAVENLRQENITKSVYMVGNTVIDALHLGLNLIRQQGENKFRDAFSYLDFSKRIILITGHRRESFGDGFDHICNAIAEIANTYKDVQFVYPVHFNPHVREPVNRILQHIPNVFLIEPLDYPYLIWLMEKCYFVLTDSGGIQEEAPALGKPVLVLRDTTERPEAVSAGTVKIVGTDTAEILRETELLLTEEKVYHAMAMKKNPYGNGTAAQQIAAIIAGNA